MPPSVYIETSIVSYLVARPSRDVIMAERQRQTREWWTNRRGEYALVTSETTVAEARRGDGHGTESGGGTGRDSPAPDARRCCRLGQGAYHAWSVAACEFPKLCR
jgi:hypothetical protein